MDNKNTLQITAQYPAERYNLLVPMQTVAEIAEIHKPVMNAVQISTNEADKEIYLQDRSKAKADGWALTKKGLNKLMRAAGIKILGTRPIIPSTCQKCAEVNKSIGRPVNCGTCGNKDVKFEARISVPQLTGENIEIVAHKEIIVDDVSVGMTEFQKKEFLKFRSEMCETKAINRALRAAMHIKGTYSLAELAKPFVVAYLVPNLDNEAVKAEAVRHFFASAQEAYALGLSVLTAIKGSRNLIPLITETGEPAGGKLRIDDPSLKILDDGAAQLTLNWRSRRPYDMTEATKMQTFEVEGWKNPDIYIERVIPAAFAEAITHCKTMYPTPPQNAGTIPGKP